MIVIDSEEVFAEWLAYMQPALAGFEDFALPSSLTRGFSRQSLVELEEFLLAGWPDEKQYLEAADEGFVDGVGRYLGEAYLRVAGGGWQIDLSDDAMYARQPVVVTFGSEGVPLAPYSLASAALHRRTGREFSRVFDNLVEEIELLRADRPTDWRPPREPVPGMTEGTAAEEQTSQDARAWTDTLDERLKALRQRLGPDVEAALDLSAPSLAVAEAAALADFATSNDPMDVHRPNEYQLEHAAYLGATLLRAAGGRWILRPGNPGDNFFLGNPYVLREDADGDVRTSSPLWTLKQLHESRRHGVFAEALVDYAKEY